MPSRTAILPLPHTRTPAVLAVVIAALAAMVALLPDRARADVAGAPQVGCGGTALVKPDGSAWTCSFDDEFTGTALDRSKWLVQTTAASGYHSGIECYVDSPDNVAVADGYLRLTARQAAAPFTCPAPGAPYATQYTSGMVDTAGIFTQAYGRFEVRAKIPAPTAKGLQESFWLWPANSTRYGSKWPASGEIDIAEMYSQYPTLGVPYIHYNAATTDPNVTSYKCVIDPSQFHDYTLEWTSQSMTVSFDGRTCLTDVWNPLGLTRPAPFDQPFMVLLTQALGIGTNAFDPATTPLPATTQIDYVRVWK